MCAAFYCLPSPSQGLESVARHLEPRVALTWELSLLCKLTSSSLGGISSPILLKLRDQNVRKWIQNIIVRP